MIHLALQRNSLNEEGREGGKRGRLHLNVLEGFLTQAWGAA